jgi:type I restriction enzyme, S subunit
MAIHLKPYPAMRETGIGWLEEIPEHWEILPGRSCIYEKHESNIGMVEDTVLSLSYGQIIVKPKEKLRGLVPESFETYQVIDPGDVICRPTDLQNDHTSLRFGIAKDRGIITSAYICFGMQPRLESRYGHLLFHAYDLKKIFYGFGSGLRQNLSWEDFKYLPCTVPPLLEQTAIVKFLDYMDQRIKKLIAAKKKLITLLEEQKQAIIHQAVTKGLDPDVPMKDSGVEWLGRVPEHWGVLQIGKRINLQTGFPFKSDEFSFSSQDIPLLRGVNISVGSLRWQEVVYWPARECADYAHFELALGDIVLGMDRPIINSGIRIAQLLEKDLPCLLLQRVARIRPLDNINIDYLIHLLAGKGFMDYLTPIFTGVSVPHLSPDQIRSFRVALPPMDEQLTIVSYLESISLEIDATIVKTEQEVSLINEYRTRLIADVVTGKLDVQEAAAKLPGVDSAEEGGE